MYESRLKHNDGKWSRWELVRCGVVPNIEHLFDATRHGHFAVARVAWTNGQWVRQWRKAKAL